MCQTRLLSLAVVTLLAGCNANAHQGCALVEIISPVAQVVYPVPSASGVPTLPSVVLYYANAGQPVPLVLAAATSTAGTAVPVPSPLPSPIAQISPLPGAQLMAASFPTFAGTTTYDVRYDQTTSGGCGPTTTSSVTAAGFTTR